VEWLSGAPLAVRGRGGGERFKPHPTRPSKTLKRLFQDANVPEFERARLPLVWRGEDLIFVAGLGADVRLVEHGRSRVMLSWQPMRAAGRLVASPASGGGRGWGPQQGDPESPYNPRLCPSPNHHGALRSQVRRHIGRNGRRRYATSRSALPNGIAAGHQVVVVVSAMSGETNG